MQPAKEYLLDITMHQPRLKLGREALCRLIVLALDAGKRLLNLIETPRE
jgi:hypothetical protein